MDTRTVLRQTVASFFQIELDQVTAELSFGPRMQGSVARARLDAAIRRRLATVCPEVYTAGTYAELEAAILGKQPDEVPAASAAPVGDGDATSETFDLAPIMTGSDPHNLACGIDIESPESLPIETDYWQSEFYRANFSSAEIAYCITQADPRQHFAARWCVKEALKKCDARYISCEMNRLEVVCDKSHRPAICLRSEVGSTLLPVAVSLTHIGSLAAAIVIQADGRRPSKPT